MTVAETLLAILQSGVETVTFRYDAGLRGLSIVARCIRDGQTLMTERCVSGQLLKYANDAEYVVCRQLTEMRDAMLKHGDVTAKRIEAEGE